MNLKRDTTAIWSALARMAGPKAPKRPGGLGDGLGAVVQQAVARALHDLGGQHAPIVVDGDDHGQLAIELVAALLGEVLGAFVLDLAAHGVVVDGIDLIARGRADVALFGPGVFFVDALFNLRPAA